MRPVFHRAALVTVCALFAALIAAGPASARVTPAPGSAPAAPQPGTDRPHPVLLAKSYTAPMIIVRSGDTLSSIARRACHHASFWPEVWWANRHKVGNPNLILKGERLKIPACRAARRGIVRAALDAIPAPPPAPAASAPVSSDSPPQSAGAVATQATYSGGSGMQACIIARESGGNAGAVNPTSGAGGLYQFLPSTWASTPYGSQYPGGAQTAPVSVQNAAYAWEVGQSGYSAWGPYDGC